MRFRSNAKKSNALPRTVTTNSRSLDRNSYGRLKDFLNGKVATAGPRGHKMDGKITTTQLDEVPRSQWWNITLGNEKALAGTRSHEGAV